MGRDSKRATKKSANVGQQTACYNPNAKADNASRETRKEKMGVVHLGYVKGMCFVSANNKIDHNSVIGGNRHLKVWVIESLAYSDPLSGIKGQ